MFIKKIIAVLSASVMMLISSANIYAYTPRISLSDEECNSQYWIQSSEGNVFSRNWSRGGGNCTWYAFGRAWELIGELPSLSRNGAHKWYTYDDGYPRGSEPIPGAVACWSDEEGTVGHVAVVEAVNGDEVTFSESGWSYSDTYFKTYTKNKNNLDFSVGGIMRKFQGYIYLPIKDSLPVMTLSVCDTTEQVKQKNGINIYINNKLQSFSEDAVNIDGSVYVPARDLLCAFNGIVEWDSLTKTIEANINNSKLYTQVNSTLLIYGYECVKLEKPVFVSTSGKAMLPLRAVINLLGGEITNISGNLDIYVAY